MPPAKVLAPMRVTTCSFVGSGVAFCHTDAWTNRTDAHRMLNEYWMGKIEFFIMTPIPGNDANSSLVVMSKGTRFTQQSYKASMHGCASRPMGVNVVFVNEEGRGGACVPCDAYGEVQIVIFILNKSRYV